MLVRGLPTARGIVSACISICSKSCDDNQETENPKISIHNSDNLQYNSVA